MLVSVPNLRLGGRSAFQNLMPHSAVAGPGSVLIAVAYMKSKRHAQKASALRLDGLPQLVLLCDWRSAGAMLFPTSYGAGLGIWLKSLAISMGLD